MEFYEVPKAKIFPPNLRQPTNLRAGKFLRGIWVSNAGALMPRVTQP